MKTAPDICIVTPCYHPREGWHQALADRFAALQKRLPTLQMGLIVVNDGDPAAFSEAAVTFLKSQVPGITLLSYPDNKGKGAALRYGIRQAAASAYVLTDIDFPYTLDSMAAVMQQAVDSGGIVLGHRDQSYYQKVPFFRRMLSQAFRVLLRMWLRLPTDDTQCGLKAFDNAGRAIFLETSVDRFLFDLEFLVLVRKKVPVHLVEVQLKEGVVFSNMGLGILLTEMKNLLHILWRSWR